MAEWPRAISPEDRIKYLIQARHDFKEDVRWDRVGDQYDGSTTHGEYLYVDKQEDGQWRASYLIGSEAEDLGLFPDANEATKAIIDHCVVVWAVLQAWEDVAS